MSQDTWERVAAGPGAPNADDITEKLRVPGGFLYRTRVAGALAMTFVPDELEYPRMSDA